MAWLIAMCFACGCADPTMTSEPTLLDEPLGPYPDTLGEVGIYEDITAGISDPRAFPYAPRYPLYSNGLSKERFLVLPRGERIDTSEQPWSFPVGTLLFKTFHAGDGEARTPVETRVLRRIEDGWDYAVYLHRGGDAERLTLDAPTPVEVTVDGETFEHLVPDRFSCRMCHESHTDEVIGFDALQLGGGPDSNLAAAIDLDLFDGAPADPVEGVAHPDPDEEWVLRYVQGNCAHCHNGLGGSSRAFDMAPDRFRENTIGVDTTGSGIEPGVRIVAGSPETSVLFRMLDFETFGVEPMPPVGVERADGEAVARFQAWIAALEEE